MSVPAGSLSDQVTAAFGPSPPARLGVAVSGGGDSLALLLLLDDWRRAGGPGLSVATVDHGLRASSAAEADVVVRTAAALGLPCAVLRWTGWDGRGNLPDRAREARYALLADWARADGIGSVALGHTLDDQAETVLMRLARGSGVDGLAGMSVSRQSLGITWVRPLLAVGRATLRDWLGARGVAGWIEDPTNDDPHYDRVVARQALRALASLGITTSGLAATAGRMALARQALAAAAADLAARALSLDRGDVVIARPAFEAAPYDTRARLLAHALMWVASEPYRPRFAALEATMAGAAAGRRGSLHGCLLHPTRDALRVSREPAAAARVPDAAPGGVWDGRWIVTGPDGHTVDCRVRALGEAGLAACPDARAGGLPRASLAASPSVWRHGELIAAPLANFGSGWVAKLAQDRRDFDARLIAH